jgi:uncharacterized membrane protein
MHLGATVEIDAPPSVVWSVLRDVERWPEWTASMSSVTPLEPGPFAVGYRARVRQPKLRPAVWRVTRLDEGRGFVWVTTGPGSRIAGSHYVEPRAGGSLARLDLEFEGPIGGLVGRLWRGLSERYVGLEAAGLKARSEERAAHQV